MRRRSKALVALAFVLSCLMGCVPVVAAKPAKVKPVVAAKPKPKPVTPAKPTVVSIAPALPGDWTNSRVNDAGTGDNQYETSITAANVQSLHQVWSVSSGQNLEDIDPPLVAGGLVFDTQTHDSGVTPKTTTLGVYDLASGASRWQTTLSGGQQIAGVADGMVFTASRYYEHDDVVRAFDQKTGAPRWTWQLPDGVPSLTGMALVGPGHLFFPVGGGIYAVNPVTGHPLFLMSCTTEDGSNCNFDTAKGLSAAGTLIYSGGFQLVTGEEFSAVDGRRLNGLGVPIPAGDWGSPLLSGDHVFFAGYGSGSDGPVGEVASFSTVPCGQAYCSSEWRVLPQQYVSRVALAAGRLFASGPTLLQALDPATGRLLWQTDVSEAEAGWGMSVAGDVLYLTGRGGIAAYPTSGCGPSGHCQPLWQQALPDEFAIPSPVITGGRLLYTDNAGLHALAVN